jgi:tRNA(Ile)-lysidine synthase
VVDKMILRKITEMIDKYHMLEYGEGVVVGLSGGPDSTCLLHALFSLREKYNIKLYAVHLNHMIRDGEAERDEEFSRNFAKALDIPFFSKRIDVNAYATENGLSSEEAGRFFRYELFENVLKETGASKIALAHNMNDQTETMIMRLLRGAGISGIVGIRPIRDNKFIRPILSCERYEIEEYCKNNKLMPVIDSTNSQSIYTRNRIRLEIIPYIKKYFNPNIDENFFRISNILREEEDYLNHAAQLEFEKLNTSKGILRDEFTGLHTALQRRIIRLLIENLKGDLKGIESKHIEDAIDLIRDSATGKRIMLPQNLECVIEYGYFRIIKKINFYLSEYYDYKLIIPGTTDISIDSDNNYKVITKIFEFDNKNLIDKQFVKYFDYDKIKDGLYFRNRRDGDYISPKGMTGTKKLKEIFIDKKIPKDVRETIPLIAKGDGSTNTEKNRGRDSGSGSGGSNSSGNDCGNEILWILNMRDSKNYKINNTTKNVLEITIIKR